MPGTRMPTEETEWVVDDDEWLDACREAARVHFMMHAASPASLRSRFGAEWRVPVSKLDTLAAETISAKPWLTIAHEFPDRVDCSVTTRAQMHNGEPHVVVRLSCSVDWGDTSDGSCKFPRRRSVVDAEHKRKEFKEALKQLCVSKGWKLCKCGINAHVARTEQERKEEKDAVAFLRAEIGI